MGKIEVISGTVTELKRCLVQRDIFKTCANDFKLHGCIVYTPLLLTNNPTKRKDEDVLFTDQG